MDLRFMADEPSAAERAVIARLIDPVESRNGQVVRGGHAARGHRHLLLPALAAVQSEMGWVSRGALNEISRRLLVPPAEAYGVASFYALISTEPRPPEGMRQEGVRVARDEARRRRASAARPIRRGPAFLWRPARRRAGRERWWPAGR